MKMREFSRQLVAAGGAVLICLALVLPSKATATPSPDIIERWNIAMTDFSAGLPPPGSVAATEM